MVGIAVGVVAVGVGAAGYGMYKKMEQPKSLTPWIGRRLGAQRDIVIDEDDVHLLGSGPHPQSGCKRGKCASAAGRTSF